MLALRKSSAASCEDAKLLARDPSLVAGRQRCLLHDSGDGQPHQVDAAALLNREVDSAAVRRPTWRALTAVQDSADFTPIAAVGVHHPNVRILHSRLAVGQSAASAAENNSFSVRRP